MSFDIGKRCVFKVFYKENIIKALNFQNIVNVQI